MVIDGELTIDEVERRLICERLDAHKGDKKSTAKSLGITLRTLYNKLHKYEEADGKIRIRQKHPIHHQG